MPNSIERVPVVAAIPSLDGEVRVNLMTRYRLPSRSEGWAGSAQLEAAQKAVEAPLALPDDVQEVHRFGRTLSCVLTAREDPSSASGPACGSVLEAGVLDEELKKSTRMPDTRTGDIDNSVVTGRSGPPW